MGRNLITLILIGVLITAVVFLFIFRKAFDETSKQIKPITAVTESPSPSNEDAELVGFNFLLDFIESAPPKENNIALRKAYNLLSETAKEKISDDNIHSDLTKFIRIESAPDQGVSIEDLQISDNKASLIVGLNYLNKKRVLRSINMVIENGEWRVDSVDVLSTYPPQN